MLNNMHFSVLGAPADTDQQPPPARVLAYTWKMFAIHFSLERIYFYTLNHWEATNISCISGQCGFDCVITVDVGRPGNQTL